MKHSILLASFLIASAAVAEAQQSPPAPQTQQWAGPEVTLHTTKGDIVVTLDTVGAPKTARQFMALVMGQHYDGAAFYRVDPGFLIQAGDLDRDLGYRPSRRAPVPLETDTNKHAKGAVALAHADDPNSGESTFYIDLAENSGLNATPGAAPNTTGYAVFGHVTRGMDVVEAIAGVPLAESGGPFPGKLPKEAVVITKADVTKQAQ